MDDLVFDMVNELCEGIQFETRDDYVAALEREIDWLVLKVKQQEQLLGEANPLEGYVDTILEEDWLISMAGLADDYGLDIETFEELLYMYDIVDFHDDKIVLAEQHHGLGYTLSDFGWRIYEDGRTEIVLDIKWTQRGRLFIYYTLRDVDVFPIIEEWD